ncbi:MAG TPA: MarP family serine protease [Mycobacteriales bacterium]|nr:MarP family serine protease [Mycobacteriales bacterium]
MSPVDLVVLLLAVAFAVGGYRQGLISSVLSFVGFVGGAAIGTQLATPIATNVAHGRAQTVVAVAVVLGCALIGQLITVPLGAALRDRLVWRPARAVDSVLGAITSALTLLIVAWMIATPLASSPYPDVSAAVRRSDVIKGVDDAMPSPLRSVYNSLRDVIDRSEFPAVFGPLDPTKVAPVKAPDPRLLQSPVVQQVRASIVKVNGLAPSCSRRIEGSGFVYAPGRVMTNAHVVAGTDSVNVEVDGTERTATVVVYDADRDVAVLSVPGMQAPPLAFAGSPADRGDDAIIAGYPGDGPFFVGAARIRQREDIRGPNIYQSHQVTRDVYTVRGDVRSGNSGGPLLTPNGHVYGVIFAAAVDQSDTGFALTAAEVSDDAHTGTQAGSAVSTGACD